jgi:hypothetical protein
MMLRVHAYGRGGLFWIQAACHDFHVPISSPSFACCRSVSGQAEGRTCRAAIVTHELQGGLHGCDVRAILLLCADLLEGGHPGDQVHRAGIRTHELRQRRMAAPKPQLVRRPKRCSDRSADSSARRNGVGAAHFTTATLGTAQSCSMVSSPMSSLRRYSIVGSPPPASAIHVVQDAPGRHERAAAGHHDGRGTGGP